MSSKPKGGKRPGSGRKTIGKVKRVSRTFSLDPDAIQRIDANASEAEVSSSELVNRWANSLRSGKSFK